VSTPAALGQAFLNYSPRGLGPALSTPLGF